MLKKLQVILTSKILDQLHFELSIHIDWSLFIFYSFKTRKDTHIQLIKIMAQWRIGYVLFAVSSVMNESHAIFITAIKKEPKYNFS